MFEFVRKHNKIMQVLLFLLIVPSFVLFGVERYNSSGSGGPAVAKVDGQEITQNDWDNEHRREVDRVRQQMPGIDMKMLDTPQARYGTLERMVRERVLVAAAAKDRTFPSDRKVQQVLGAERGLDQFYDAKGKLDTEAFTRAVGKTPAQFRADLEQNVAMRQVLAGVQSTAPAASAPAGIALSAFYGKREIQVASFNAADYAGKVQPTQAEIEAFYKDNAALFQAPEQATIEYVVLDQDAIRKSVAVNEQELKTYYEQNRAEMEERLASHILITSAPGASAADKDKARARAQELYDQVKKSPDSFAEVAKKNSQDPGSAANGGSLDWFLRKAMVKPFSDAAFSMQKGEIRGPVESEFGFHVIKLVDVRGPTYEQVRPDLEARIRKEQSQRKFAETADAFNNAVYEATDGFKSVADRFKVDVKTATVQRTPAAGVTGPAANPKLLAALFTPDSIEKKRNTEGVETGPGQLTSARVVQYSPARTRPLAEVQADVRQRLIATRSAEMAKKEGTEKLAAWKAAPATASALSDKLVVSRAETSKQPGQVVEAALRTDANAFTGVDLGLAGYAIVKVTQVLPREAPPAELAKQELAQYAGAWSSAETLAYYTLLQERFKAKILVPKPSGDEAQTAAR
jgi:peptidyl-prolyl cis-trans isomerase D